MTRKDAVAKPPPKPAAKSKRPRRRSVVQARELPVSAGNRLRSRNMLQAFMTRKDQWHLHLLAHALDPSRVLVAPPTPSFCDLSLAPVVSTGLTSSSAGLEDRQVQSMIPGYVWIRQGLVEVERYSEAPDVVSPNYLADVSARSVTYVSFVGKTSAQLTVPSGQSMWLWFDPYDADFPVKYVIAPRDSAGVSRPWLCGLDFAQENDPAIGDLTLVSQNDTLVGALPWRSTPYVYNTNWVNASALTTPACTLQPDNGAGAYKPVTTRLPIPIAFPSWRPAPAYTGGLIQHVNHPDFYHSAATADAAGYASYSYPGATFPEGMEAACSTTHQAANYLSFVQRSTLSINVTNTLYNAMTMRVRDPADIYSQRLIPNISDLFSGNYGAVGGYTTARGATLHHASSKWFAPVRYSYVSTTDVSHPAVWRHANGITVGDVAEIDDLPATTRTFYGASSRYFGNNGSLAYYNVDHQRGLARALANFASLQRVLADGLSVFEVSVEGTGGSSVSFNVTLEATLASTPLTTETSVSANPMATFPCELPAWYRALCTSAWVSSEVGGEIGNVYLTPAQAARDRLRRAHDEIARSPKPPRPLREADASVVGPGVLETLTKRFTEFVTSPHNLDRASRALSSLAGRVLASRGGEPRAAARPMLTER